MTKKILGSIILLGLLVLVPSSAAAQGNTPPEGWHEGQTGWQVSGPSMQDPECQGQIALDIQGAVTRYGTFLEAEAQRSGRQGTYWCEGQQQQSGTPTQSMPSMSAGGQTDAMTVFCNGFGPLIFNNGMVSLGTETVSLQELPRRVQCTTQGQVLVVDPWRPGCNGNLGNPNCVFAKIPMNSMQEAVDWLVQNNWPSGSFWMLNTGQSSLGTGSGYQPQYGQQSQQYGQQQPQFQSVAPSQMTPSSPQSQYETRIQELEQEVREIKEMIASFLCSLDPTSDGCIP